MIDIFFIKHSYTTDYHYMSPKPSINNAIVSTPVEYSLNSSQDSHHFLSAIHYQYHNIIQLFHHQHFSLPSPASSYDVALPCINIVSTLINGKPLIYWVIDASDIYHITLTLYNFTSYSNAFHINMILPNDTTILTNIVGTVCLYKSLIQSNVY